MIFTKWKMNEPAPPELMHPCEEKHKILFLSCSGYWEKSKDRAPISPNQRTLWQGNVLPVDAYLEWLRWEISTWSHQILTERTGYNVELKDSDKERSFNKNRTWAKLEGIVGSRVCWSFNVQFRPSEFIITEGEPIGKQKPSARTFWFFL